MSILVAIDTFTASGTGTAITTPSQFKNITVIVSGSGTVSSVGLDVLLANGTWVSNALSNQSANFGSSNFPPPTLQRIDGGTTSALGIYRVAISQMGVNGSGSLNQTTQASETMDVVIQGIRSNISGTSLNLTVQVQARSL